MKRSELKVGDKVVIVNQRGDGVGEIYLNKAGDPPVGGHYVDQGFWEAEVVDPDAEFHPVAIRDRWKTVSGVRVRLLTNCRHGYADRFQPSPFGSGDVLKVDGKGDEITVPSRLIVNKKAMNDRLRRAAKCQQDAADAHRLRREARKQDAVNRLNRLAGIETFFTRGAYGTGETLHVTVDDVEKIIAAIEGSK